MFERVYYTFIVHFFTIVWSGIYIYIGLLLRYNNIYIAGFFFNNKLLICIS